jgi:uncharacterized protein
MRQIRPPLLTCEPVLTETIYFLREDELDIGPVFLMLERRALLVEFDLSTRWPRVQTLMERYDQMDLADAALVVMTEIHRGSQVLTLDRTDFSVYRKNDRQVIPFVAPPASRS